VRVPPFVVLDHALPAAACAALHDAVTTSGLLGESPLGGTFLATRGFSITFHRARAPDVVARFPALAPFLALVLDEAHTKTVQPRPLLGGAPIPNAFYLNVLVVPPGAAVGRHIDATLGPPSGRVIPEAVSVLYLDVPTDLRGGELVLYARDDEVGRIRPATNRSVLFWGALGHEVTTVHAGQPRTSIVCEQYALAPGVLSVVPEFKLHSRNGFQSVLDRVRRRDHRNT
jgi:hypothetical protein